MTPRRMMLAVAAVCLTAAGTTALAQVTWTGAGGSGSWSVDANWNPREPVNGDAVVFDASAQTNVRADFSSYPVNDPQALDQPPLRLPSITFDASAPSYTIELYYQADSATVFQANLELDGVGVVNSSGQTQTFTIDQSTPSLFNYPPSSSITFNNAASAANATYRAEGGSTQIQTAVGGQQVAARSSGGRVLFHGAATAGSGTFIADGGAGNGAAGARVEFHMGSTAAGGTFTNNGGASGPSFGNTFIDGFGGRTSFFDTATAGTASFTNNGEQTTGGTAGITTFAQNSSAASGVFVNNASNLRDGVGGATGFTDNATAGNGTFTNTGGAVERGNGGTTQFEGNSTAGSGRFTNLGGAVIFGNGGQTIFDDASTAGSAAISNAGPSGQFGLEGKTRFNDSASASGATITNLASSGRAATTDFYGTSTAASATITNQSGPFGMAAGITTFHHSSSAGIGTFINDSALSGGNGEFIFNDTSTAGQGTFTNGNFGGFITFHDTSTAGQADIALRGTGNTVVQFREDSSAGAAHIDIGRLALGPANESNDVQFYERSTAANSNITIRGDGGRVFFAGGTAGTATIVALGSTRPGNIPGTIPGQVQFNSSSTAGNATITAQAATVAGAPGGLITFLNGGRAGTATITANGGASAANGGGIRFQGGALGDSARLVVNAGAFADFTNNVSFGNTVVGSIEGAGTFSLGGSLLTVGNLNTSTTVSGTITDTGGLTAGIGGRLTKVGTGALTLSGVNGYTGLTTVDAGTLNVNGFVMGDVLVNEFGTLAGTGEVGGTISGAGVIAPGLSPGTLTAGALLLSGDSVLEFELGTNSDQIVVEGNITLDGTLNIFNAGGLTAGTSYPLFTYGDTLTDNGLQIGTVPAGFSPSDFSFDTSTPGQIGLVTVPEPSAILLAIAGVVALANRRPHR